MSEFRYVTSNSAVEVYESCSPIFKGILKEVRILSIKKPEATMSAGKVKIVNRILNDLLTILKDEPSGKYLEALDDDALPQMSDAVLTMVQFETALNSFYSRYNQYMRGRHIWITNEFLEALAQGEELEEVDIEDLQL